MRCEKHDYANCRECFPTYNYLPHLGIHPVPRSDVAEVVFVVRARINNGEVDKTNRKGRLSGRAHRTAETIVESLIADALKHNWIVESYQIDPINAPK